jgi:hypothetical protein
VRVARLRLGDPQGHWLEIDGARFHLVPSALLRLNVEIATVGGERALALIPEVLKVRDLNADVEKSFVQGDVHEISYCCHDPVDSIKHANSLR